MAASPDAQRHASRILEGLRQRYPVAECALRHDSPFQLLIATILSAQCTDERVNLVTRQLFADYPTAHALAAVPLPTLEKAIQSTGFFRNKAKNIQACCRQLVERFGGELPRDLEALVALPGVGRKTANVVLGTAFGMPTGVVVDTHVTRISGRLGLTRESSAEKIERDLMELLPQDEWITFSHRVIHHGRQICKARKPACDDCLLREFCPQIGVAKPGKPGKSAARSSSPKKSAGVRAAPSAKTGRATAAPTRDASKPKSVRAKKRSSKKSSRRGPPSNA